MVQVFGIAVNVINVLGFTILLGIGVDVVIHLSHRIREEGHGGIRLAFSNGGNGCSGVYPHHDRFVFIPHRGQ